MSPQPPSLPPTAATNLTTANSNTKPISKTNPKTNLKRDAKTNAKTGTKTAITDGDDGHREDAGDDQEGAARLASTEAQPAIGASMGILVLLLLLCLVALLVRRYRRCRERASNGRYARHDHGTEFEAFQGLMR